MPLEAKPVSVFVAGEDDVHAFLIERLCELVSVESGHTTTFLLRRSASGGFYDTRHAARDAQALGLKLSGRRNGHPRSPEAVILRRIWAVGQAETPDVVIALSDSDGDDDFLAAAYELAVELRVSTPPMVVGICHRDAEAWIFAGYKPTDGAQAKRLNAIAQARGFDPTRRPEKLTGSPNASATDAKRNCLFLLGEGRTATPEGLPPSRAPRRDELAPLLPGLATLEVLSQHHACGAAAFIAGLRSLTAPV